MDLIIFDEWWYVPVDRDGARLLFQIVSDCYERRSVILTTYLEFSRWVSIFYDEHMTTAMIDLLVHHCHLLVFDGESWRMKTRSSGNNFFPTRCLGNCYLHKTSD